VMTWLGLCLFVCWDTGQPPVDLIVLTCTSSLSCLVVMLLAVSGCAGLTGSYSQVHFFLTHTEGRRPRGSSRDCCSCFCGHFEGIRLATGGCGNANSIAAATNPRHAMSTRLTAAPDFLVHGPRSREPQSAPIARLWTQR
jgi:hypothetical protein